MRVLCTCLPGFGHFNPLVPLARALVRAGHEVAFATAADFCPRVRRAGFGAFPAGMSLADQLAEAGRRYPELHAQPPGTERFVSFVPRMLAGVAAPARAGDLVRVVQQWRPEVVVHDEAELAGPVAAAVAGIPWASHSIVLRRPWEMARLAGTALAPLCDRWGVELGPLGGLYRYLHLDACPPSLQDPGIEPIAVAHPVRNTTDLDTAEDDVLPVWVEELGGRPTVYVTLGTVFNRDPGLFAAVLEGVREHSVDVVATVGERGDPAALGVQPPHVHLARYVPLSLLLEHLDVVVTQGGTSILPALGAGLPLLLLPQGADQFHNAEACVRAGVGRRLLPGEVSAARVGLEVRRLLDDPAFALAARRVAAEIGRLPAPDAVVPVVEQLAVDGQPRVRAGPLA